MEIEYGNSGLAKLVEDDEEAGRWGVEVVNGYRKVIRFIRAAADERDFRAMRSLNFEQLKGDREGQYSLRINQKWRLIIEIREGQPKNTVRVMEIVD